MPAAAVIPAPIAYIKIVAVKKLVVGSQVAGGWSGSRRFTVLSCPTRSAISLGAIKLVSWVAGAFTLKKLECSKRALQARIIMHGIME